MLRRLSLSQLRPVIAVAAAVSFGAGAGALLRGDRAEPAPDPSAPAAVVTAVAGPEREEAALTATPEEPAVELQRGRTATVEFSSRPGSSCQLELQHGQGPKNDERLPVRRADQNGRVAWEWELAEDAPQGDAQAVVVCSGGATGRVTVRVV